CQKILVRVGTFSSCAPASAVPQSQEIVSWRWMWGRDQMGTTIWRYVFVRNWHTVGHLARPRRCVCKTCQRHATHSWSVSELSMLKLLPAFAALAVLPIGDSRLAVIQKAPDFELMDQAGSKVRMSALGEKVLLVSFIFTTCNGTCPATTHRMAKV